VRDFFNEPIFVLGLPRSGTSMIAGALGICGAWTGTTLVGGTPANPKGFFEHSAIKEQVTQKVLAHLQCDPLGITKLPPVDLQVEITGLADYIQQIIEADGCAHKTPWLCKDPKLTLLWPIYAKAFPKARWVIVNRDEDGFIDSCLRTNFMARHSQERGFWRKFAGQYRLRLDTLRGSGEQVLEISSPDIIAGNIDPLDELVTRLGLQFRGEQLRGFITPSYWHGGPARTAT